MTLSVLQRASAADVRLEPFPHLVLEQALPAALCDELIANYPALDTLAVDGHANNTRWNYPAPKVAGNGAVAPVWREFTRYHASPAFFAELAALFADAITRLYPEHYADPAEVLRMRAGVRGVDNFDDHDILLDAQISGNTPVTAAGSVRTTHVDRNNKLFSGLLYLRPDADDSAGGDLTLSRFRPGLDSQAQKLACFRGVYVDDAYTEVVRTVPYAKNTLVLFINGIDSLHGVTVRQPTPHSRLFFNLIGEVDAKLYPVPRGKPSLFKRLKNKLSSRDRTAQA